MRTHCYICGKPAVQWINRQVGTATWADQADMVPVCSDHGIKLGPLSLAPNSTGPSADAPMIVNR